MIGSFGVLSTGFVPKRLTDIIAQWDASLTGDLGAAFQLLSQTPEGQLVNRGSEQVSDLWEGLEAVYNSFFPSTASGVSLDNARSLENIPRIPATASVVNGEVLTGTPGTVIPNTLQLSVAGNPGATFTITAATVIGGGGTVTAAFVADQTGPIPAAAATLTTIVTAVAGLTSVSNPTAAQVGTYAETDMAYRLRSAQELSAFGTGTFSGLLQAVQAVPNVSQAWEFVNDTDTTDANDNLPHSVLLVVVGGVDQDILNAIFAAKAAGINTNGTTAGTVTDSQGIAHAAAFSRLVEVPIYMDITITPNTNPGAGPVFPGNGLAQIQAAIVNYGSLFVPGQTVVETGFFTPINQTPGVLGAVIKLDTAPSPAGSANIPMTAAQVAQFLPANILVHE